ncbi:MAG: electron transfer flavoprotein subunit alpha/FixB family protein [Spirochaetia bacterium]|nr:electron transfer flavoprotein subunit alpha/FixB family protein [Spirochaetia bacterium]
MQQQETQKYSGILVYGSHNDEGPSEGMLELLGEAGRLQRQMDRPCRVHALLIGDDVQRFAPELGWNGADEVICIEGEAYRDYRPDLYIDALEAAIEQVKPEIALILATVQGSEMASSAAVRLRTGLAAHCVELRFDQDAYVQVVPAFAGKILGDIYCPDTRPQMATIKKGMFERAEVDSRRTCRVRMLEVVNSRAFDPIRLISSVRDQKTEDVDIGSAEVVIGGGLGIGSKEHWEQLEQLASLFHGAVGCTRPALDQGWTEREDSMIGTSGAVIHPALYMSIGISGAAHHTCGIKDPKLHIAINRDPHAAIFATADIGVAEEWDTILPLLIDRLAQRKEA